MPQRRRSLASAAQRLSRVPKNNVWYWPEGEKWVLKNKQKRLFITREGRALLRRFPLTPQERRRLKEDPLTLFTRFHAISFFKKHGKNFALKWGGKHGGRMLEGLHFTHAFCALHNRVLRGKNAPKRYRLRPLQSYFATDDYWAMEYLTHPTLAELFRHPRFFEDKPYTLEDLKAAYQELIQNMRRHVQPRLQGLFKHGIALDFDRPGENVFLVGYDAVQRRFVFKIIDQPDPRSLAGYRHFPFPPPRKR